MKNLNLILILSSIVLFSSCRRELNLGCISPEGSVETRTVEFDDFDALDIREDIELFITEGDTQEVVIEAASNIIDRLIDDSSVSGDELILEINGCARLRDDELIVRITMPEITSLQISGDGKMETVGNFGNVTDLRIDISGDGQMELELGDMDLVSVSVSGDGHVECSGAADAVDVKISGDGQVKFFDLESGEADVDIEGDGKCEINVTENLKVDLSGDAQIEAIGSADTQEIRISGEGKVKNFEMSSSITDIRMSGSGDVEVSVSDELIIDMSGSGKICYKGSPLIDQDCSGDCDIKNCD